MWGNVTYAQAGYAHPLELTAGYLDAAKASFEWQAVKRVVTSQASSLQNRAG